MGVLELGDLAGLRWERRGGKIGMLQSVNRIDAFPPVELEKLCEQRDGNGTLAVHAPLADLFHYRTFCVGLMSPSCQPRMKRQLELTL